MAIMLNISTDILPQTCLSYLAFRVAFQDTLERIVLARQIGEDPTDSFGYLTEVPFLRAVPPHVQLDLLGETWHKHIASDPFQANLVDESVVYATCETAAAIAETDPQSFRRYLEGGPLTVDLAVDEALGAELRALHLRLSSEGEFLMISQFEDMDPDEASRLKRDFGLDERKFDSMFDVLGRWSMSAEFLSNLLGLMSKREIVRTAWKLGVK